MSAFENKVEEFAHKLIEQHGFRFNEGFACLVPDKDTFPSNEGLFLWGFSQKRMRFETKIEKFHTSARIDRMEEMLNVSGKDYKRLFSSAIENYLKSLKEIGFKDIGKGVVLFEKTKLYNVQADALYFEKNLDALKKFELLTLSNPIIKFVEARNYFKVKNRDKLVWDKDFGRASSAASSAKAGAKAKAAAKTKATAKKATPAKKAAPAPAKKATVTKKAAPAKTTPAKKAPVAKKAAPAETTPAKKASVAKKAAPAKTAPAKKAPVAKKAAPAKTAPAKTAPAKTAPAKKAPVAKKAAPAKTAPAKTAPVAKKAAQVKTTPAKKAPVTKKAAPVKKASSRSQGLLATVPLADNLKKLAITSQPEPSIDEEEKKSSWTKQVNGLYKKVQNWLSAHQKNGHIAFNVRNLGAYEIDSLELDLAGGHQVTLQPIEMNILGSVGRIDVDHRGHNSHKVMLLLHGDSSEKLHWELWKGFRKEEQQLFNKENLEALLNQWIGS